MSTNKDSVKLVTLALKNDYAGFRKLANSYLNEKAKVRYNEDKIAVANQMFGEGTYQSEKKLSDSETKLLDMHEVEEKDENGEVVKKRKLVNNKSKLDERKLFQKKPEGPSKERIRQAVTKKDEKEDAKEWGGKGYFNHREVKDKK